MPRRIALASHDGKFIDTHFGHADRFAIVDLFPERYELVELRQVTHACGPTGHDEGAFDAILSTLSDCEALFVERIGYAAAQYVASKGFRVFEAPYAIEDVLKKLVADGTLEKP